MLRLTFGIAGSTKVEPEQQSKWFEMITEIVNIIGPVFIVAGIGYLLESRGVGFQSESLSRLTMLIGTPCLVFSSLTNTALPDDALLKIVVISVTAAVFGGVLASAALFMLRLPWRTFVSSLALPNAGNAGLPLVFFACGEPGLAIGAAFFFLIALIQYTVVPAVMTGDPGFRKLLREPLVWSIAAVIVFRATDLAIPKIVANTTSLLGGIMIPIMLILLGGALARLKVAEIKTSVLLAFVRLAIGVVTGFIMVILFQLQGVEAGAIFLLCSMPSAIVTYVIAQYYGCSPERVAGHVVCSTVLNFACLPIIITMAIYLAG